MALMGLGGVVAGALGIALPEKRRLGAVFPLILGAGVGIAVLGIGPLLTGRDEPSTFMLFLASVAGFVAVCTASWVIWRRAAGADVGTPALD